ncbi:hypothetical protein TEA_015933 [Camellia sinensis var. sinensis]|uniref:Uncharacterized protein n=1 Tax=Camellia sinensis var. sinensis TaxID=542762 RepID=A0A4S4F0W2_CAMSN|nr:hypothetical protein TEA_015933 [Camellia sinensis var. sinensis]
MKKRGKATRSAQRAPVLDENVVEASLGDTSSFREVTRDCKKRKRKEPEKTHELNDVGREDDSPNERNQSVVWTDWMHHKFLEAIEQLGHETFFPTSPSAPNFNSCLPHLEASTSTSNLGHPYGRNVSSLDAIAQNNIIFLDFGTSQFTPQTGRTQVDPGYVPSGLVSNGKSIKCGQMGGVSSNDEIDYIPRQQPFLAGNGKSVKSSQMGVLGNDENRTIKANLLVQFPSTSIDYIPQ